MTATKQPQQLRSAQWFNNPQNPEMTALYLERYLNYGLTLDELQGAKPIIGIAQTGSDLAPCNRHHQTLSQRVRDGIIAAGGIALEFPVHPIQETGKRPTAMLDRNLAFLSLSETLFGYPLDGVVLTIGCDKTTPALLMAAAMVNIPAIALSVGPMLNGWHRGQRVGSGSIIWQARNLLAEGKIDHAMFMKLAATSAPSVGYCNTMGTASTMNSLAEVLGMQLPGSASIPAPYRERAQMAFETGKRSVELVWQDLKPSDIITAQSFANAIVVNSAIGGSTNAPIHINAIAAHLGIELSNQDWQQIGYDIPLLANVQPAGKYLSEDFYRAGGISAICAELLEQQLIPYPEARMVNGKTFKENYQQQLSENPKVILSPQAPLKARAGFLNMKGNLFDSAIMKTSVISDAFRQRFFANSEHPDISHGVSDGVFRGKAVVFDGPEHFHANIDNPQLQIDANSILVMRGVGPKGYPGASEVVNMRPPDYLIKQGIDQLPCIGDGRQSGTSGAPSILNASPEAAAGGNLAILRNGDDIEIDLNKQTVMVNLNDEQIATRWQTLNANGGYPIAPSQTPWQALFREKVQPLSSGMTLHQATEYKNIANTVLPRDNH